MRKVSQHICLLTLAISLVFFAADGNFIDRAFSVRPFCLSVESPTLPSNVAHLNSDNPVDEVFVNDFKVHSAALFDHNHQFPTLVVKFNNLYRSSIWQPPKFIGTSFYSHKAIIVQAV